MYPIRRARRRALSVVGSLFIVAGLVPATAVPALAIPSPDLVISQVYGGGGNVDATYTHEFIEVFNRGNATADLTGKSLQYGATAGNIGPTTAQITVLTGFLAPGQYLLVQEAQGAGGTTPLPPPDVTDLSTPIAMSATGGKVVLVNRTTGLNCGATATPCSAGALDQVVDLIGYGGANMFETAPTPALTNTTAALRLLGGCQDTDNNLADFAVGAPAPRNRTAPLHFCEGDAAPSVTASNPAAGAVNVARNANVSITFSEPVDVAGTWFSIDCAASGNHPATSADGPTTFTLDPTTDFAANETCTVTVFAAQVTDQDANDPPNNMTGDQAFTFTTVDDSVCGDPATFIHDIQGTGAASPMTGQVRTIEGVVVGDFQASTSFNGFHVQEEDADADSDPATSEGIFVFEGSSAVDVSPGDLVRVKGQVVEFASSGITLTELTNVSRVLVCSSGESVTPAAVTLPVPSVPTLERYEGMLVSLGQELTATETFTLGRFGEVALSVGGRLSTPTAVVDPGAPAQALQDLNDRSRILLDDGDNRQNIDPTLYPQGGLSASNTLRIGDTLAGGTFVLEQRFGVYRLQPVDAVEFQHDNPRPTAPEPVGGNVQVAAFNVLNYFTTLDPTPGVAGPFNCGPTGGLECRGANSAFELQRQRDKIVSAMLVLDADVLGLMELENNDHEAIEDLVDGLNASAGAGTYTYIDTGTIGTDAIKVGVIYKPAIVTPVGSYAILDSSVDPRFIDTRSRPSLAQTFELKANGERFTVDVNHLKSKGSACTGAPLNDPDTGDGQGNCNLSRTRAAEALVDWLATDPTGSGDPDVIVVGDMNAYAREDPIGVFEDAGYTNTIASLFGPDGYSYVFEGQSGYLDHALSGASLTPQVNDVAEWHINADEPVVLDYNTDFKTANQVNTFYAPTPYRSSDHDPVVIGIDLGRCLFSDNPATKTRTLLGDCSTSETIRVPDGWTLDGDGHTISAYDPEGDHFRGAVVANGGATAHVTDVTITTYHLADVCDDGADRLRGILFDGAAGSITNNRVIDLNQGFSGCQEGNAIEVRNAPFDTTGPDVAVTISGNETDGYQKTGILANGSVVATILGNVVAGWGPTGVIAQNGIQVGFGGSALISDNSVSGNFYTGPDLGCGLLFFEADGVKQKANTLFANERDVCNFGRGGGNAKPGK